ncbi:MAG TPA: TM1802 family CRISPR-associated protein, partial [bacterium]|nr:TM1802 family CRISPR-associated protein [bacterium]
MLEAMRVLALNFLAEELGENPETSLIEWFEEIKKNNPKKIFSYLVEDLGKIEKVFYLEPDREDKDLVFLRTMAMSKENQEFFPFVKPCGGRSGQIGPVIKKSNFSPTTTTISTTCKNWRIIAKDVSIPISSYYKEILDILERPRLSVFDKEISNWNETHNNMLDFAVDIIGAQKSTVILTVKNLEGKFPGEIKEYLSYLIETLAISKYETIKAPKINDKTCCLCGKDNVSVYANGMKGAGINFGNIDRDGSFSGVDLNNAWKNYSICGDCADLLFIFKNHVLKANSNTNNNRTAPFRAEIAGEKALILPCFYSSEKNIRSLLRKINKLIPEAGKNTVETERRLLNALVEENSIMNLNFYWLSVGQCIDDLHGSIQDVLPSRLREISTFNDNAKAWQSAVFPKLEVEKSLTPELSLNQIKSILRKPGGKKVEKENKTKRVSNLRRAIVSSIYNKKTLNEDRLFDEIVLTAQCYLNEIVTSDNQKSFWGLVLEGKNSKKNENYFTVSGWIRHVAWWLYYFRKLEVMKMSKTIYQPESESLKPYFSEESGIDSKEKAFAFVLGILFGRLLTLQGAKGVNVGSNALTWLKRLTLKGSDLPELYVKVREKLISYRDESNEKTREVIHELGKIGMEL